MLDSKLTVGAELLVEYETGNSDSDEGEPGLTPAGMGHGTTVMIGPTVLYKPTRNTYLGLVLLVWLGSRCAGGGSLPELRHRLGAIALGKIWHWQIR